MRQQYGLRVNSQEFREMEWGEFCDLLSGLNEQTPLVRVAQIRTETDAEAIKRMTPEQRAMRAEWQRRRAMTRPKEDAAQFVASLQAAFAKAFG